jgi:hypothetical protein
MFHWNRRAGGSEVPRPVDLIKGRRQPRATRHHCLARPTPSLIFSVYVDQRTEIQLVSAWLSGNEPLGRNRLFQPGGSVRSRSLVERLDLYNGSGVITACPECYRRR